MIKIIIVDSNILFREGLCNLLKQEIGILVVGEASSIKEAMDRLKDTQADLALVDADLPDMDEFQGIRQLRVQRPGMQIVLLSAHDTDARLIRAVQNGARGYLPKNNSLTKFMASIRAIERGEVVVPRAMVGQLLDEVFRIHLPPEQDGMGTLTPRELDVLMELGRGRSNRQIAENLRIAENTVKVHVHNILEKLNLRNRRQAARFARSQEIALNGNTSPINKVQKVFIPQSQNANSY